MCSLPGVADCGEAQRSFCTGALEIAIDSLSRFHARLSGLLLIALMGGNISQ